jgi:diaminopimelate decarboxylase
MEVDVVADAVSMNHYSYGDYLIFKGQGAYRNNMLPFFINARPAIVCIIEDGFKIIRERQTSNEMLNLLGYSL